MNSNSHIEWPMIKHSLINIFDNFIVKFIVGWCLSGISWALNNDYQILWTLLFLIIIDTLTGMWYAIKTKSFTSRGFYKASIKIFVYFIMILVSRIIDKHTPVQFAATMMDAFLVLTEAYSILENFGKLGYSVPSEFLKKIKSLIGKK